MAESDPTLWDAIWRALDKDEEKAAPYFTWLPDWVEPHAVKVCAVLILILAAIAIWEQGAKIWRVIIKPFSFLRRHLPGYVAPSLAIETDRDDTGRVLDEITRLRRAVEAQQ